MQYNNVVELLLQLNLSAGVAFNGLDNVRKLCQFLGHPEQSYKIIHVAGTNGKGSVCAKIARGLELSGYKVGLYSSPHFSTFRERIKVNQKIIPKEDVCEILPRIYQLLAEHHIQATFFEITTVLALEFFHKSKVEYVVLETGIGGARDATNIVTPILSVITSISLEHTDILGSTIKEITEQKAGIIKKNIPAIIGPKVDRTFIEEHIQNHHLESLLYQIKGEFESYDDENNAIATKAMELLKLDKEIIRQALKVRPIGRFQIIEKDSKTIVLDVAHNPNGLEELFKIAKKEFPDRKFKILFGLSKNKDIKACLSLMTANAQSFYPVMTTNGRGFPAEELAKELLKFDVKQENIKLSENISQAFKNAVADLEQDSVLIICGTFFIMSEIMQILQLTEEKDSTDLNEKFPAKSPRIILEKTG